jgi:steroid delta-isomerase-like uncharacterized protein
MSEQHNTQLGRAFFDNINTRSLEKNVPLQLDNVATEAPGVPGPMTGDRYVAYLQNFITAFPDLHFDVLRTIAQDDLVVVQWVGVGTHTGPLQTPSGAALPPTSQRAAVPGTSVLEIIDGKIARNWVAYDMAGLLGQLGVLPPM